MSEEPAVSVVIATHNRAERLARLLDALSHQDVSAPFEVIVIDDGSQDSTARLLTERSDQRDLELRVVRRDPAAGPATARNVGWRLARAPFVAFTDDDCVVVSGWLRALLDAWDGKPDRIVQGPVRPDPRESMSEGPFTRSLRVEALGPYFQTANVAYPRELLDRTSGFAETMFSRPSAEDADLAQRCLGLGAHAVFAPEALVEHAVHELGAIGKLRVAWRWHEVAALHARHPEMKRHLHYRIFWKGTHWLLARAMVGFLLPRRWRALRFWCFAPIVPAYLERARTEGYGRRWSAPYFLLHDLVEMAAIIRGAIRHRQLLL